MSDDTIPAERLTQVLALLGVEPDDAAAQAAVAAAWACGYRSLVGLRDAASHFLDFGVRQ